MEERKIWKSGKGSFVTALPPEWAKQVKDGKILVSSCPFGLILRPAEGYKQRRRLELEISDNEPDLLRYDIITAYLKGYDEVNVRFENLHGECIDVVQNLNRKLFGYSHTWASSGMFKITIATASMSIPSLLDTMFSQYVDLFTRTQKMLETGSIPKNEKDDASYMEAIEDNLDRQSFLIKRLFNRLLIDPSISDELEIEDHLEITPYQTINVNLERLGDLQFEIYRKTSALIRHEGKPASGLLVSPPDNYGFAEYHLSAHGMVQEAYSGEMDKVRAVIRTKREDYVAQHIAPPYIKATDREKINKLTGLSRYLICLDHMVWGMVGNSTNIAEAWLNMQDPLMIVDKSLAE